MKKRHRKKLSKKYGYPFGDRSEPPHLFVLDHRNRVKPVWDVLKWSKFFISDRRQIADSEDTMTPSPRRVSTVFVGIDIGITRYFDPKARPEVFESMVIPEWDAHRTATYDEALAMHAALVKEYEGKPIPDGVNLTPLNLQLFQAAQEATDTVMGEGTYVKLNGFDPSKGETRRSGLTENGEYIPPLPNTPICGEYDPAGPGAIALEDGLPQCAQCGWPKTSHEVTQ